MKDTTYIVEEHKYNRGCYYLYNSYKNVYEFNVNVNDWFYIYWSGGCGASK